MRAWARSADMHETNDATGAEAEAIREWIARYEPRLFSPLQRTHLLPKLRELILAAEFPTLNFARTAMSRSVRFIADTSSPETMDLGELLSEVNVAAWSHGRLGRPAPSPQEVSSVRRLLRLHHALSPRYGLHPARPA